MSCNVTCSGCGGPAHDSCDFGVEIIMKHMWPPELVGQNDVLVTHIPTGMTALGRSWSQIKARDAAVADIRARLAARAAGIDLLPAFAIPRDEPCPWTRIPNSACPGVEGTPEGYPEQAHQKWHDLIAADSGPESKEDENR